MSGTFLVRASVVLNAPAVEEATKWHQMEALFHREMGDFLFLVSFTTTVKQNLVPMHVLGLGRLLDLL